jgi:hypothetical protein
VLTLSGLLIASIMFHDNPAKLLTNFMLLQQCLLQGKWQPHMHPHKVHAAAAPAAHSLLSNPLICSVMFHDTLHAAGDTTLL